ncbi:MAG: hypothetical protein WC438_06220 [Candidatus Pacearchaeota archaeon]
MGTSIGNYGRAMYKDPIWLTKMKKLHTFKKTKIKKICPRCGKIFVVIRTIQKNGILYITKRERKYCSLKCANTHILSNETKQKISKKLDKRIDIVCPCCHKIYKGNRKRKFCSQICFQKNRHQMLEKYLKYKSECNFRFSLNKYKDKFDLSLIKKYGWYKAKNRGDNQNGISRDHIISVKYGYENNISPKIISHPANCQLLRHKENMLKGKKSKISLKELKIKIKNWALS